MDRTQLVPRLKQAEGCTNYMYLCTGGKVTVGVGHAIENPAAALKLNWTAAGSPAAPAQVQSDYARIAGAVKNKVAAAYAGFTTCRLSDADIDALLASDIAAVEQQLQKVIPTWASLPDCVQQALFDMAYNLGVSGLKRKFPKLLQAVAARDWAAAAAQCRRNGINDERNQETAQLFLGGASPATDAVNA